MPRYRNPDDRASETVTIRLTLKERRVLEYLAEVEGRTLTDTVRILMKERLEALGIDAVPEPIARRKPGRPKRKKRQQFAAQEVHAPQPLHAVLATPPPQEVRATEPQQDMPAPLTPQEVATTHMAGQPATTVGDLVARFRQHFSERAEGTKREVEETILFLCDTSGGPAILPAELPLTELSSDRLRSVRQAVLASSVRFAKKNLHLTYLRMMLHFAVKQPDIAFNVNPAADLEPLRATESKDGWPHRPWT